MAGPYLLDRVKEISTTTGTGTLTLAGAVSGYRAWSAVGDGNSAHYAVEHATLAEWEVGIGTYTASGTTLARNTVLSSSNAGAAVNFSAGTKNVWLDQSANLYGLLSVRTRTLWTVAQAVATFTTTLSPMTNSRFRLLASDWVDVAGATPQYRVTLSAGNDGTTNISNGDVLELDVYDADGAASILNATLTASGAGTNAVHWVQTAWANVPASKNCYLRTRNQTFARGQPFVATLEIRYN